MDTLSLILSFIFGTVVGSFLNVVALRFNTGMGLGGRSKCMSCGTSLTWKELVPLFSFAVQKGSCRKCKSKISWQYPLVEFIAGAIFVLIFFAYPPVDPLAGMVTLFQLAIACLLVVISVYDIKHKIIPDGFVYSFGIIALLSLCIGGSSWWHIPTVEMLIAGPVLAVPFAFLWLISRGAWMGLGDAKLTLGIGWLLGVSAGINALVLAFWLAAAVSVIWLLATHKKFKPRIEIPFGPYLILGMYLVLLFHIQVIDIHLLKDIIMSYVSNLAL
ncbi:MAG TPA: prepilin peptidase [Candidatus Paceibacterota bacterium]|jgi:prepilin signal peptidase PulO-like enzyme (type II secretory pathway)|nr:prepilin peptidase [Candidatus Paceibacterota bacterium]